MKNLQIPLYCFALVILIAVLIVVGCTTSQQATGFQTISGLEATSTAAINTYYGVVIKGQISTNSVPQVSKAFNDLQSALLLAATADQAGINGLAATNLVAETSELIKLIQTITITPKP